MLRISTATADGTCCSGCRPGEIHLFTGNAKNGFERRTKLRDASGAVLRAGLSSVVHVVDWEGDGDLDLVLGDCAGWVWLVRNASGDRRLRFGKPGGLRSSGERIRAPGRDSGPVVVDWDGDGRHDLVLGCGDGRVLFFRNTSREGEPVLASPEMLVGPASGKAVGQVVKLAVFDWNADGKLDLLVGDRHRERVPPPVLTEEGIALRELLRAMRIEFRRQLDVFSRKHRPELEARARAECGVHPDAPLADLSHTPRRRVLERTTELLRAQPRHRQLRDEIRVVSRDLIEFEGGTVVHGRVWLFARVR